MEWYRATDRKTERERKLEGGKGERRRGWGRSQFIRQRESLVLLKPFYTVISGLKGSVK
jgi:hypothetical protein